MRFSIADASGGAVPPAFVSRRLKEAGECVLVERRCFVRMLDVA
jgi:hypothetical protein